VQEEVVVRQPLRHVRAQLVALTAASLAGAGCGKIIELENTAPSADATPHDAGLQEASGGDASDGSPALTGTAPASQPVTVCCTR